MLLESYLQEVGATVAELEVLTYGIESTEKFVSFRLDSARNRLLKVDVLATASATALGLGQLVSGIFGMNLPTKLFDPSNHDTLFIAVSVSTVLAVLLLIALLLLVFYSPLEGWCSFWGRGEDLDVVNEHLGIGPSRHGSGSTVRTAAHAASPSAATERQYMPATSLNMPALNGGVTIAKVNIASAMANPASRRPSESCARAVPTTGNRL